MGSSKKENQIGGREYEEMDFVFIGIGTLHAIHRSDSSKS